MRKLEITYKPISEIIPYVNNARTHDQNQIDQIKSSIKEFGMNTPIGIHNDVIVYGHGRIEALKQLGETEAPTVDLSDLSKAQMKAYILADNRMALNAGWDNDLLKLEFSDLDELDFDLSLTGFDDDEIAEFLKEEIEPQSDEDAVPELQENPISKEGDIWILGNHRVMCGDSTSIDAVEKLMDGQKADLLHTDPPYNVDYSNADRPKPSKTDLGKIKNDVMDSADFYDFLSEMYKCAYLVMKDGSSAYVWHADRESINFKKAAIDAGFEFAQLLIWKKPMLLSRTRYQWAHEPCLFITKGSPFFTDDRTKTTVWDFGGYDKSKNIHPTQKPAFIPEEALNNSSKQGSNVLDLFGGSGSTLIACEKLGRSGYLMELDPKYVDVIVKRWQDYTGKEAILESTNETFNSLSPKEEAA